MKIPKKDRDSKLFQEYDVKHGTRIYTDESDTNPKILGQSTSKIPLDAPKYKTKRFDDTAGIPEDVEFKTTKLKEEIYTVPSSDLAAFAGNGQGAKQNLTINYHALKTAALPDILEFNFKTEMGSGVVKDNEYVVSYLQYKKKGAGGDY